MLGMDPRLSLMNIQSLTTQNAESLPLNRSKAMEQEKMAHDSSKVWRYGCAATPGFAVRFGEICVRLPVYLPNGNGSMAWTKNIHVPDVFGTCC